MRWLLYILEEGTVPTIILQLEETFSALALLLGQFAEEVAYALQSHVIWIEKEAQREVDVGGPQVPADQAGRSRQLPGKILANLRGHG